MWSMEFWSTLGEVDIEILVESKESADILSSPAKGSK